MGYGGVWRVTLTFRIENLSWEFLSLGVIWSVWGFALYKLGAELLVVVFVFLTALLYFLITIFHSYSLVCGD